MPLGSIPRSRCPNIQRYALRETHGGALLDFSHATDQELRDQLDRAKKYLATLVNARLEERDGSKIAEMDRVIAEIEAELDKRMQTGPKGTATD